MPKIKLFQKWTEIDRFPYHFLSYKGVNINIMPYGENTKYPFVKLLLNLFRKLDQRYKPP